MMAMRGICLLLAASVALSEAGKVTPMEKVVGLIKDLTSKVEAEGKKEAEQYDKYACFCKEQASDKLYAIEKSTALIKKLDAKIKELAGEINELGNEISGLSKKIGELEDKMDKATQQREKEHSKYLVDTGDYAGAIAAIDGAIAALKDSKGSLSADAKTSLLEVQKATAKIGRQAPKFQYQSNGIIATLEDLLATTKQQKKELDNFEFDANSAYEKENLSMANLKKFAEKDKAEAEALYEAKSEEKQQTTEDKDRETADMNADQSFLDQIESKCETAAKVFDQRSKTRAGELTAMSEAMAALKDGATEGYSANKKLNGLLQLRSVKSHSKGSQFAAIQKAQILLADAADRIGSGMLSSVALKVKVQEDHFVKVRGLIKDLIAKLKQDAKEEAEQKSFCDKGMSKNIAQRDQANADLEMTEAKLTKLKANKAALEEEISTCIDNIAANAKALKEATDLRAEQKEENEDTIETAKGGSAAVTLALKILNDFYSTALLQGQKKYVPPNSDREGNTVDDLAPEFTTDTYHGSQAESKGIVGILEVILSDFDRTVSQTTSDDKDAEDSFQDLKKENEDDTKEKEGKMKKAKQELTKTEADILTEEGNKGDQTETLGDAEAQLAKLKTMCVDGEETWEERAANRKKEIEALKEAMVILDEWQS